jgi:hypothetical protein
MANKRHSKGKMYALIRKWEQSGLPQAKFFSEHKISKSTFGYWRRKYLREQVQGIPSTNQVMKNPGS